MRSKTMKVTTKTSYSHYLSFEQTAPHNLLRNQFNHTMNFGGYIFKLLLLTYSLVLVEIIE